MQWTVEFAGRQSNSAWIKVNPSDGVTYDAVLTCGPGVSRTSFGNSSREELRPFDKPIEGIFRWDPSVTASPYAAITWRNDEGSDTESRTVLLG